MDPHAPMLAMEDVSFAYSYHYSKGIKQGVVKALQNVRLTLHPGETLGVIGETGSGKSTIGMLAVGQLKPQSGNVQLLGRPFAESWRPGMGQMVFQDPVSSLSPRMTVEEIILEPLRAQGVGDHRKRRELAAELIERVGLRTEHLIRKRSEFSGGQCQRIAIARAVVTRPKYIVLDEPTSSLDVIVQAKILKLLEKIKREFHTSYLFISHNLAVIEVVSDHVLVLYKGLVVESGRASEILQAPKHPYTQALADAVLGVGLADARHVQSRQPKRFDSSETETPPPSLSGCPYNTLCPYRQKICVDQVPALVSFSTGRSVACHFSK